MAVLAVARPDLYSAKLRKIHITVNGERVASVSNGQTIKTELPAGTYELGARLDWWRADPFPVTLDESAPTTIVIEPPSALASLYRLVWKPRSALIYRLQ